MLCMRRVHISQHDPPTVRLDIPRRSAWPRKTRHFRALAKASYWTVPALLVLAHFRPPAHRPRCAPEDRAYASEAARVARTRTARRQPERRCKSFVISARAGQRTTLGSPQPDGEAAGDPSADNPPASQPASQPRLRAPVPAACTLTSSSESTQPFRLSPAGQRTAGVSRESRSIVYTWLARGARRRWR